MQHGKGVEKVNREFVTNLVNGNGQVMPSGADGGEPTAARGSTPIASCNWSSSLVSNSLTALRWFGEWAMTSQGVAVIALIGAIIGLAKEVVSLFR